VAPYILMIGIILVVLDGLWVVDTYNSYYTYPKEAFIYLILGICLTIISYVIIQRKRKCVTQIKNKMIIEPGTGKDNRVFINKMWKLRVKIGNRMVGFSLVILAILAIFDFGMAISLLQPMVFLGMTGLSFLYIMKDEGKDIEEENIQPRSHKLRNFLRLIDYREHPFSLSLILFIIIVLTFLLSKQFGLILSLETSGNPLYVMSLPVGTYILSGLVFACGFIYIIQHCDFFGIRQAEQGEYKLLQIHFFEIIICGSTFLIWLMILIVALFTSY
jgi:hypothetical protein